MKEPIIFENIKKFFKSGDGTIFNHPDYISGDQNFEFIQNTCKLLIIGAGGLGCEILKNLCLLGFTNIDIIDMDTIELSNLNRQFLFREKDIGESKAKVAANFIKNCKPWCNVTPYFNKIQDFDTKFYKKYHIIICGLDSIIARRWINSMILNLLEYDNDKLELSTIIPLIDGGTEGFKGNVRVILPSITACIDCTLDLYPPQVNFPLCTIANRPRLPEHCIEYVRIIQWEKENPFGENVGIDGDNPEHIKWIYLNSLERGHHYNIKGITLSMTQGVVKRLVPAVASTNAVIAASCANEALKIATSCYPPINNFLFNDTDGIYCYTYLTEKKEDCIACSHTVKVLKSRSTEKLEELLNHLKEDPSLQMKNPSIFSLINGKQKTLYMEGVKDLEEKTKSNLSKTLKELGLYDNAIIEVIDITSPKNYTFYLKFCDKTNT
ncbi:unnamed protein product [Gordionus sp. m RMFG-2023]